MDLKDLAKTMKDIDFAMLSTRTAEGEIAARPMSNNRDVEYDGDSWFFALDDNHAVAQIQADPHVGLTMQGAKGLLGKPPLFIAVEGQAELIRDRSQFEAHWNKDIEHWAPQGIDTPGLVLIKVHAHHVHYWDGKDEGEVSV